MTYNFDTIIDRRTINCAKWLHYEPDILPMWVADMDFRSPEPVIQALHERVEQGTFGYEYIASDLRETIVERMARLYQWTITPDDIVFSPGLVAGLNIVGRAIGQPGDGILMTTPVYGPFLDAPARQGRFANRVDMILNQNGRDLYYEMDFAAFEAAISEQTKVFYLCNPHNPVGRVYTRAELEKVAAICLKHDVVICSDEIHADLILNGNKHIPIASLSPEIANRTVTLMAPSKTYNIPGLECGFAIVPNKELRQQVQQAARGIGSVPGLGYTAGLAAYQNGQEWLDAALAYIQANHDVVRDFVETQLPSINMTRMEGTYLAWLDCRALPVPNGQKVADFLLEKGKIALNDGEWFGRGGAGFVRLNFACPRELLNDGLNRIKTAVASLG